MSYSITLIGHSPEPHNAEVKAIAEEALRKLEALPGAVNVQLSGYSNDGTSIVLANPEELASSK